MAKNRQAPPKDMPVYLFTGFLEGGKTKFIQETLEDRRFCNGERTLLLVCEEGEEEYAPDQFAGKKVMIRLAESEEDFTEDLLYQWEAETGAERVLDILAERSISCVTKAAKVEPFPYSLLTVIRPSISSASCLAMARPSPVPSLLRFFFASTCVNSSKSFFRSSSLIPIPESATIKISSA